MNGRVWMVEDRYVAVGHCASLADELRGVRLDVGLAQGECDARDPSLGKRHLVLAKGKRAVRPNVDPAAQFQRPPPRCGRMSMRQFYMRAAVRLRRWPLPVRWGVTAVAVILSAAVRYAIFGSTVDLPF